MKEKKHIVPLTIPSYLVDYKKRLRPACFMSIAQEMAVEGATVLNFGYEDMAAHDLAWVVSRTKLIFNRTPLWKDRVEFQTWHKGIQGLYFIRDYKMTGPDGEALVVGTSSWIAFNTKERSLFPTQDLGLYFDVSPQCGENAIEATAGKIAFPKDAEQVASHTVTYADLDFIGHANNASYIAWAMDYLPEDLLRDSFPHVVEINFNKETRYGEVVDIFRKVTRNETSTVVVFEGKVAGLPHFTARFTFDKQW